MKYFLILVLLPIVFCCSNKNIESGYTNSSNTEKYYEHQNSCDSYFDSTLNNKVYLTWDSIPSFKGGDLKMLKYIKQNFIIENPEEFEGKYNIELIIDETGVILSAKILNKISLSSSDELMINIFKKMPNWKPAFCGLTPVISKRIIYIRI